MTAKELFVERKNDLLVLLKEGKDYFSSVDKIENADVCASFIDKVESGEFTILVVGEFSSGKSTFLNALMGNRYLPSFSSETTATINCLRHVNKAEGNYQGQVHYADGHTESLLKVDYQLLMDYTSTRGDDVVNKINRVDVFLDSPFLKDNVTLIDSPGLNGIADGHRETTERQINESHACIFVLSCDQPGSKSQFEFLKSLKMKVKTILFVLNKIDNVKEEEQTLDSVVDSVKKSYKQVFPEEKSIPRILPISAGTALRARAPTDKDGKPTTISTGEKSRLLEASRIEAFEDRLWRFLTLSKKSYDMLHAPLGRLIVLGKNDKDGLQQEIDLLSGRRDAHDVEEKISEIQAVIDNLEKEKSGIHQSLLNDMKTVERDTRESIEAQLERFREERLRRLSNWESLDELDSLINGIQGALEQKVKNIGANCAEEFSEKLMELIYEKHQELVGKIPQEYDFDVQINREMPVTVRQVDLGLNKYLEQIQNKENELKNLNDQLDKSEGDLVMVMQKEKQINDKQKELEEARIRRENLETYVLPLKEIRQTQVRDERNFPGIFGILFGSQPSYHTETVVDDAERKEARADLDRRRKDRDAEIERHEKNLEDMRHNGKTSEEIKLQYEKQKRRIEEMQEKIKEEHEKQREEFEKKSNKKISEIKGELEDYLDDCNSHLVREFKKKIGDVGKTCAGVLADLISANIEEQLNRHKKMLESQTETLQASEQDKAAKLNQLQVRLKKIDALLGRATELETALESQTIDELELDDL
jgi:small GTP-binding protein